MCTTSDYQFTDHEVGVLAGIIRDNLRRSVRRAHAGHAKYGPEYDPAPTRTRVALLRRIYIELGGDPDRITNLRTMPEDRT